MIDTLPNTNEDCIKAIGQLTREMAQEYLNWGESEKWKEMFDRLEAIKERRRELLCLI